LGFFCPFPQCWRGFRAWPRERHPCEVGVFAPTDASLFSVFQRDWPSAATELRRWVFGGGKVLPGLVTRREAEATCLLRAA